MSKKLSLQMGVLAVLAVAVGLVVGALTPRRAIQAAGGASQSSVPLSCNQSTASGTTTPQTGSETPTVAEEPEAPISTPTQTKTVRVNKEIHIVSDLVKTGDISVLNGSLNNNNVLSNDLNNAQVLNDATATVNSTVHSLVGIL